MWVLSWWSKSRVSYALSILLWRKLIENISRGLYIIVQKDNLWWKGENSNGFDEKYWYIIGKLIQIYTPSGWIIWWEKALEIHLQNYSIPDILIIYTRDTQLRVKLKNGQEIHFRTLVSGEKTWWKNLYRILLDQTDTFVQNNKLQFLSYEAALLDALSLRRHDIGVEESNILRFLKSHHTKLDRSKLGTLVKYRYIRAMNRLRVLSRDIGYTELYKKTLDIIGDEGWGCFLNI
jgi:hypothetical protein